MTGSNHDEASHEASTPASHQVTQAETPTRPIDWKRRHAWNGHVARSWRWIALAGVAVALAGFSLYSWGVLLLAHRPVVDVAVAGLAAAAALTATMGAGARVLVRGFGPPWRTRRRSDWWSAPMVALVASVASLGLGVTALLAHVGSADVPRDAPLADPATFGDRVTVFHRADGEVTQTSVSLAAVVEGTYEYAPDEPGEWTCWTVLMDGSVDRRPPGAPEGRDGADYTRMWTYFPLLPTRLETYGSEAEDVYFNLGVQTDCPSTEDWTFDPIPYSESEVSRFSVAFRLPAGEVPAALLTTDAAGRELTFSFDSDGCLANEAGLDPWLPGESGETGCEFVVDSADRDQARETNGLASSE